MADTASIIADLQRRLQRLEDKESLASLLNRYCKVADDHQWRAYAETFFEDGTMCFENWGVTRGRDAIEKAASVEDRFGGLQHSMTNMEFTLGDDGQTARGTCYLWFAATMDTSKPREHHAFGGHYTFTFARTDAPEAVGGWLIKTMNLKKIWAQNEDKEGVFGN
jgi:hypothetical protein